MNRYKKNFSVGFIEITTKDHLCFINVDKIISIEPQVTSLTGCHIYLDNGIHYIAKESYSEVIAGLIEGGFFKDET